MNKYFYKEIKNIYKKKIFFIAKLSNTYRHVLNNVSYMEISAITRQKSKKKMLLGKLFTNCNTNLLKLIY